MSKTEVELAQEDLEMIMKALRKAQENPEDYEEIIKLEKKFYEAQGRVKSLSDDEDDMKSLSKKRSGVE